MSYRRRGLIATAVLALSLGMTACHRGSGSSAASSASSASSSAAASKVVSHTLDSSFSEPHTVLRSGAAGNGPIPSGAGAGGAVKAQTFEGIPKVGAVFFSVGGVVSAHYCTGSVVHSGSGDLIVTAGHCVYNKIFGGWQDHIVFVPGYHDDIAPYGLWVATTAYLNAQWVSNQDPDGDIAFLKVRKSGGGSQTLESLTGADTLAVTPGYENPVSVVAYPLTAAKPVGCGIDTKKFSDTQLELDCAGLPDGASGSPFIASGNRLVGVLGGYEQGGNNPDISYSIYFTDRVAQIYRATAGS